MSDTGFILHPEAALDITEIWEYIASDNRRPLGICARASWKRSETLSRFHISATCAPT
jgi:hypothetical protein